MSHNSKFLVILFICAILSSVVNAQCAIPVVPSTTSTSSVSAGSSVNIPVLSSTGFYVTEPVTVGYGGEAATISAIPDGTHITITTLVSSHTTPFTIFSFAAVSNSAGNQFTFTWTTNILADTYMIYGAPNTGTPIPSVLDPGGVLNHTVTVTGLIPQTAYSWQGRSQAINSGTPCGTGYYAFDIGTNGTSVYTANPPAGNFDFGIFFGGSNPSYVTQGYGIFTEIQLQDLVYDPVGYYMNLVLTGLPNFTSILWTNDTVAGTTLANGGLGNYDADTVATTTIPGDTLSKVEAMNPKEIYLLTNVGGTTTPGSYTVTVTVSPQTQTAWNSGTAYVVHNAVLSGGINYVCILANTNQVPPNATYWYAIPIHTATFPVNVVSSTAPFSGVAFPYSTPTLTGVGYPAIPNLSTFKSTASTYGQENCAQDGDASPRGIRANDQTNLTPVGFATTYASWFYDGVQVYYNVQNLLNTGLNWEQCRTNVKQVYRNNYAIPNTENAIMAFSHGYYTDYLTAAEPADITVINKFNSSFTADLFHAGSIGIHYLQREVSYMLRNQIHGIALGQSVPYTPGNAPAPYMQAYLEEHVLGMLDQLCLTQNADYWENFMVGLQVDSLIQYYNLVIQDPRIPPAIKCTADYLYANQWQQIDTGAFPYDIGQYYLDSSVANGGSCMVNLDQYNTPMFAWLFKMTGSATYQTEGDAIFAYAAALDDGEDRGCQGGPNSLTWPGDSQGKQFSQQYYLGTNYVTWRSAPPVSTVPASGVSF